MAKSEPDGYALLVVDLSAMTMTPVSILAYSPHIFVVANKLPVKTLDE